MAITKERKQALVSRYQEMLERSPGIILTSYSGLTMKQLEGLRRQIRELGGEFHIVKNTLLNLASQQAGITLPEPVLRGTTAIGFASEEVPPMAKAIVDLSRESESLWLKGGVIRGELFDAAQIERLADLPPLPVVQAQLLGLMGTPATRIAGALAGSLRQVASVLKAYSESESAQPA